MNVGQMLLPIFAVHTVVITDFDEIGYAVQAFNHTAVMVFRNGRDTKWSPFISIPAVWGNEGCEILDRFIQR